METRREERAARIMFCVHAASSSKLCCASLNLFLILFGIFSFFFVFPPLPLNVPDFDQMFDDDEINILERFFQPSTKLTEWTSTVFFCICYLALTILFAYCCSLTHSCYIFKILIFFFFHHHTLCLHNFEKLDETFRTQYSRIPSITDN